MLFFHRRRRKRDYIKILADFVLDSGVMPPKEIMDERDYKELEKAIRLRQEYDQLFTTIPFRDEGPSPRDESEGPE